MENQPISFTSRCFNFILCLLRVAILAHLHQSILHVINLIVQFKAPLSFIGYLFINLKCLLMMILRNMIQFDNKL